MPDRWILITIEVNTYTTDGQFLVFLMLSDFDLFELKIGIPVTPAQENVYANYFLMLCFRLKPATARHAGFMSLSPQQ